jgi:hypothetical protein
MIKKIADAQDEEYDWNESIVDLLNAPQARQQSTRPQEARAGAWLRGQANWLRRNEHLAAQQVMQRLAESGGVVPETLKHADAGASAPS